MHSSNRCLFYFILEILVINLNNIIFIGLEEVERLPKVLQSVIYELKKKNTIESFTY